MKHTSKMMVLVAAALLSAQVFAQTTPTLTFTTSATAGDGSVSPALSWTTTPAATSCTASGHSSWTGTKPAASPVGGVVLPALTTSGTYTLTMSCSWAGGNTAIVNWVSPTQNTDGSALTLCASSTTTGPCLAKFQVYRSTNSGMNSPEMTPVNSPTATSLSFSNLSVNTHYFGVEVVNGNGVPSAMSNIASKVITSTSTSVNRSVTITVNPKPGTATVTVQ